jgi:DNA-binding response OmpR family regulator
MVQETQKKKVLVVDDQQYIRTLLKDNLEYDHFKAHCTSRGADALACLSEFKPHLAIVDIGLPDMSGWKVCEALRKACPGIEIIVLSAKEPGTAQAEMKQLGLRHFVAKPYDPIALSDLVKQLLQP